MDADLRALQTILPDIYGPRHHKFIRQPSPRSSFRPKVISHHSFLSRKTPERQQIKLKTKLDQSMEQKYDNLSNLLLRPGGQELNAKDQIFRVTNLRTTSNTPSQKGIPEQNRQYKKHVVRIQYNTVISENLIAPEINVYSNKVRVHEPSFELKGDESFHEENSLQPIPKKYLDSYIPTRGLRTLSLPKRSPRKYQPQVSKKSINALDLSINNINDSFNQSRDSTVIIDNAKMVLGQDSNKILIPEDFISLRALEGDKTRQRSDSYGASKTYVPRDVLKKLPIRMGSLVHKSGDISPF